MAIQVSMIALALSLALAVSDPPAAEHAELLAAGRKVVESLPTIEPGEERHLYFELRSGPGKVAGYSQIALRSLKQDGETVYDYASDTVVSGGRGPRIAVAMRATLKPTFEPMRAEMWRETVRPENVQGLSSTRAKFEKETVEIYIDDGEETASATVPLPERPFVFGVEALVAQLGRDEPDRFAVREYSVPTGGAGVLICTKEKSPEGQTLVAMYPDTSGAYQFWFDSTGGIQRWLHTAMPMLFVRSTRERVEELQKTLGPPMKIPDKAKEDPPPPPEVRDRHE